MLYTNIILVYNILMVTKQKGAKKVRRRLLKIPEKPDLEKIRGMLKGSKMASERDIKE